jgi:hypothetical protein
MNRSGTLAITIAALSVLAVAFAAVAAPYPPKSSQCYGACTAKCAAQHSCELTISAKLFVELSVIVSSPPSTILHCETRLPLARMCRSQTSSG